MAGVIGAAVQLMRPKNLILAGATVPLGAFFALQETNTSFPLLTVLLHTLAVMFFMGAGNAMNDIKDAEIDLKAHPQRPIPSGAISLDVAKRFTSLLWVLSVIAHIGGLLSFPELDVETVAPLSLIHI